MARLVSGPKPSSQESVAWLLVHHAGFTGAARRHLVGPVAVSSNGMSWKFRAGLEEGFLTGPGALSNHAPRGAEARPRPHVCLGASLFAAIASLARLRRRHDNLFLDLAVVGGTLPA